MNFLYDNIVHVLQNTIDSHINSGEITQCNGHYAKVTDFGTNRKLIRIPISDEYSLTSYLALFPSYG